MPKRSHHRSDNDYKLLHDDADLPLTKAELRRLEAAIPVVSYCGEWVDGGDHWCRRPVYMDGLCKLHKDLQWYRYLRS